MPRGLLTVAQRGCQWIGNLGCGRIVLKADQGPAITDLQKRPREDRIKAMDEVATNIRSLRGVEGEWATPPVVPGHSPVGGSNSNGAIENTIKRIQSQIRTLKPALSHVLLVVVVCLPCAQRTQTVSWAVAGETPCYSKGRVSPNERCVQINQIH